LNAYVFEGMKVVFYQRHPAIIPSIITIKVMGAGSFKSGYLGPF